MQPVRSGKLKTLFKNARNMASECVLLQQTWGDVIKLYGSHLELLLESIAGQRPGVFTHVTQAGSCFFMPDVPHLLKNLCNHLTRGQVIKLLAHLLTELNLPGAHVSIKPIEQLVEIDACLELKLAPHLKPACVQPGHYEKMKVGYAFSLFNNDNAAPLRRLAELKKRGKDALTTAWFVESIFTRFKMMSSRTTKLVISHFNENQYKETVSFLEDVIDLFEKIHIWSDAKYSRKPVQTGIVTAITVMLEVLN